MRSGAGVKTTLLFYSVGRKFLPARFGKFLPRGLVSALTADLSLPRRSALVRASGQQIKGYHNNILLR
jgi:hypothetical protein